MDEQELKRILEAAMLAAARPLPIEQLLDLFPEEGRPERKEIRAALAALSDDCAQRGVEVKEVSSGFRFQVKSDYAPWVSKLWEERPPRYSRALLETLALIAYRQPITRAEIEDIRGVAVSTNIMKTLLDRNWVRIVGHRDVPGRPALFATTKEFLDYFSLTSLEELPTLAELRDLDSINAELEPMLPLEENAPQSMVGEEAGPANAGLSAEPEHGEQEVAEEPAPPVAAEH
jgi:segregation and condensation protein B